MIRRLAILLAALALVACSNKGNTRVAAAALETKAQQRSMTLAYEHSVSVEAEDDQVQDLFSSALASCKEAAAAKCEVLDSRIDTGKFSSASLKIRAAPEGIQSVLTKLDQHGQVTSRTTTAEDLATPIEDGAKKLTMLNDYRSRLEELRARAGANVDALMKVNQELARVQTEIEAAAGEQARLAKRVRTEVLNISIATRQARGFLRPIRESVAEFGDNLAQGIASAVSGVAFLLPWTLVLTPVLLLLRKFFWRRRGANA
ncbi:DUF4349 domain-containing protein [Pelomonas sp. SE-A7]|uniref:DUF4349 domain-containing protein n=1 Tax=Pelomonas sp. SE-A7 TaxID=3054953 RepID=UPI00259CAACF|nr:DUF4349 domain-containing protein [Pelomonas sp. SE-A7]MDM4768550.1 DUF4349 domain-containing protein [Pelomonas sp. SE-A7]